jgi:hypothetical protein
MYMMMKKGKGMAKKAMPKKAMPKAKAKKGMK